MNRDPHKAACQEWCTLEWVLLDLTCLIKDENLPLLLKSIHSHSIGFSNPRQEDPCWGPTQKAQQRCLRSGALRTGRSSPLSSCLTKPPQRFGILEWVMVTSQLLAASQVCRCQRLCCTEIVPPSFPTWRETSVEMEQQKYPF